MIRGNAPGHDGLGHSHGLPTRFPMFKLPPRPEYFSPDHEALRSSLRGFVEREISPFVAQ